MTKTKSRCLKKFGALIVAAATVLALPPNGRAMLAPADVSSAADASEAQRKDLQAVRAALESKVVRQRLADLKFTPAQVNERLDRLSGEQIHQAALQAEAIHPGGDAVGVLAVVALVLLVVYLFQRV